MTDFIKSFFKKDSLSDFNQSLSRERLIQSGRIIVIDDEDILLISELKNSGFAVDHDRTGNDLSKIAQQIYDLAIVDYHGVGQKHGAGQGADIVKHIKRVSPRTRIIAYTSRGITASVSEFFTLSHIVLPKDLGLEESLTQVEEQLSKAFAKEHLFESLIEQLKISNSKEKQKTRDALIKALKKKDESTFKGFIAKGVGVAAEKAVDILISKIFI